MPLGNINGIESHLFERGIFVASVLHVINDFA